MSRFPVWFNPTRVLLVSEMLVNLAAGWIGVVIIAPGIGKLSLSEVVVTLTINGMAATLSLLAAEWLRERSKEE